MVLAGGTSRRFGGKPKGLELLGASRIIDRVVSALRQVTDDIVLASNDPDAHEWGLDDATVVSDTHPGAGGLAGVESAMRLERDVLVVAWDMPFVSSRLLSAILAAARTSGADVVVPESRSPHGVEPFCGFYAARLREALAEYLTHGGGAAHRFIAGLPRVHRLPLAEVRRAGEPDRLLFSVNTPADLERARAMVLREE